MNEDTDAEVEAGTMTQTEATALLETYQYKSAPPRKNKNAVEHLFLFLAPWPRRLFFPPPRFSLDKRLRTRWPIGGCRRVHLTFSQFP